MHHARELPTRDTVHDHYAAKRRDCARRVRQRCRHAAVRHADTMRLFCWRFCRAVLRTQAPRVRSLAISPPFAHLPVRRGAEKRKRRRRLHAGNTPRSDGRAAFMADDE